MVSPSAEAQSSGSVQRRISRACDKCNQLRAKCDGEQPCVRCKKSNLVCEYKRQRRKRGKASNKWSLRQTGLFTTNHATSSDTLPVEQLLENGFDAENNALLQDMVSPHTRRHSSWFDNHASVTNTLPDQQQQQRHASFSSMRPDVLPLNNLQNLQDALLGAETRLFRKQIESSGNLACNNELTGLLGSTNSKWPLTDDDIAHALLEMGVHAGDTSNMPSLHHVDGSPMGESTCPSTASVSKDDLRYPVLRPLVPYLRGILPVDAACDLLEFYFATPSKDQVRPVSPYVLAAIFRKRAVLHPSNPRVMRPALLASMLWVAAQTSDVAPLTMDSSVREQVCQALFALTTGLLSRGGHEIVRMSYSANSCQSPMPSLMGDGEASAKFKPSNRVNGDHPGFDCDRSLDDVITYIHLATVVSASESKTLSLLWWNAAWSLARRLSLCKEKVQGPMSPHNLDLPASEMTDFDEHDALRNHHYIITEEEREERRRTWWLLYITDRHLGLCYNRPLIFLDTECAKLKRPMSDVAWQEGSFAACQADGSLEDPAASRFKCLSHDIFGFFLPLMTILGEIVDLQHARNHVWLGSKVQPPNHWDFAVGQIGRHLEIYQESVSQFEHGHTTLPKGQSQSMEVLQQQQQKQQKQQQQQQQHQVVSPDLRSPFSLDSFSFGTHNIFAWKELAKPRDDDEQQTRLVATYARYLTEVLRILLQGRWDPLEMLDCNTSMSSKEVSVMTGRAVSAALILDDIMECDLTLELMPFFFSIYLLHGSFPLLLATTKVGLDSCSSLSKAYETTLRAHHASVVTLSTEYQRNFSKVLRSALSVVRGRSLENADAHCQFQRQLLSPYRWTSSGSGLAL